MDEGVGMIISISTKWANWLFWSLVRLIARWGKKCVYVGGGTTYILGPTVYWDSGLGLIGNVCFVSSKGPLDVEDAYSLGESDEFPF